MPRLIDADAIIRDISFYKGKVGETIYDNEEDRAFQRGEEDGLLIVERIIYKASTVDAVPVVRCKDCKHWTVTCDDDYQSCECDALIRHKDFYCANGERKEE